MNTKHISLAFAAVVTLLASCAKSPIETPSSTNGLTDLELTYVGAIESKAVIDGTTFPTDGEIGLFLFKDEMATQDYGEGYKNVKYAYNSSKSRWTASPSIKVGSTPGYLYGYYPYDSEATDVKAIPVESSLNGDDVMYATKQTVNDKTASQTAITMNHALARVSITVINNGYTGEAKLSQIKFEGAKLAASGTLDATNGIITATKADEVALSVPAAEQTIATGDGTVYECLLVPSETNSNRQDVTLTLTIDGEDKTATLSGDNGVIFAQGTKSNITITLSNSGISVQTVSVEDWKVVEVGGHKVAVKMDEDVTAHDVLTEVYVDGNSVIVNAWSKSGQHLKCLMPDGEFCTSQSKTGNLVYTFTISDITENTTATIGYASPVSIAVTPDKGGSVEISGGDLYEGETITLAANPAYEYGFDAWLDKDGNPLTCEEESYSSPVRLSSGGMSVQFKKNLVLDGEFSVASGKKVRFTRGNLYRDGSSKVEQHQYDYNSSEWTSPAAHVSHFMWCNNLGNATAKQYNTSWDGQSPFFTEVEGFTVNGFSAKQCRTLKTDEWQYLFGDNDARRGKYKLEVTVCGKDNCIVLLPDNWTGGTIESSYDYVGWKHMEEAGAVCLPAAGSRNGLIGAASVNGAGGNGSYWSASSHNDFKASALSFNSGFVYPGDNDNRNQAYSVRLVTDVTK